MFKSDDEIDVLVHPSERLRLTSDNALFAGKHFLVCVTGSIAAVETVKLIRSFIRLGAEISVAMTESATQIVHPEALRFASGKRVITALDGDAQHVTLCISGDGGADGVIVAPCTANMISKLACGICDDPVSTMLVTALGAGKSIIVSPAMHGDMWANSIVADNLKKLQSLGVEVVAPILSDNKAKMADIESIIASTGRRTLAAPLSGRNVTVIGGSTVEPIDSVRAITNMSTGGTAIALAREAYFRGAEVELLLGEISVAIPGFLEAKRFKTVDDLKRSIAGREFDIVLVPAAISDYIPEKKIEGKMPSDRDSVSIVLKKTEKIIDFIEARTVIGFKLEANLSIDELKKRATERLRSGNLSAIVANRLEDVTEYNSRAFFIDGSGEGIELEGTRELIARGVLDNLTRVL